MSSNTDDAYVQDHSCKIYNAKDFFTTAVQLVLAFIALASLYIKRLQEVPRRTFGTWFLDVSKQATGACYAHVLNMIIAAQLSERIRGTTKLDDQCAWYGMSYILDTTLGLLMAVLMVQLVDHLAEARQWQLLKDSGVYVGSDGWKRWLAQLLAWITILTLSKVVIFAFMFFFSNVLAWVGGILFKPLQFNIRFELVFVMILFPGLLNIIYFWIADSFLKAKKENSAAHEPVDGSKRFEQEMDKMEKELSDSLNYQPAPWSHVDPPAGPSIAPLSTEALPSTTTTTTTPNPALA